MADELDVLAEQDKVTPEIVAAVRKIDRKQRVKAIIFDFTSKEISVELGEGEYEYDGITFVEINTKRVTLARPVELVKAIANSSAATIPQKMATKALSEALYTLEQAKIGG